jgi:anti-sigma28 factor (negative regulator of flagellin synthesis)
MDPTRPIDSKTIASTGPKATARSAPITRPNAAAGPERAPATESTSIPEDLQPAVASANSEARQRDNVRLAELRAQVTHGRYKTDAAALAKRILEHTIGVDGE